jgi:hypothetical protein
MEEKTIKSIAPEACPYCGKEIFVTYEITLPLSVNVLKIADIESAKELLITRLDEIVFTDAEEKNRIIAWVNDPETLITADDVNDVINKAKEDQK